MRMPRISGRMTSCYYPACKHSQRALAYYIVLETTVVISPCVVAKLPVAPTNSVLVSSTVNTPHPSHHAFHLTVSYGIRAQRKKQVFKYALVTRVLYDTHYKDVYG